MGHPPKGFNVGGVVRSADEEHRAATPLELLFDLCFVVAVAQAAAGLHELVLEREFTDGIIGFCAAFFGIWWAWVNVVWFTTGHDSDDVIHRLLTLVQMAGALILAAGVHDAMVNRNFTTMTVGYVVMRLGLVPLWIRVGRDQPAHRDRCLRYAASITAIQILWCARLALPDDRKMAFASFAVGVVIELLAPVWAERKAVSQQFNGGHLAERFGLFVIIVLGEVLLSSTIAVQEAIEADGVSMKLLIVAGSGLVIAFAFWWGYFARNDEPEFDRFNGAFFWGYGHLPVFGGLAAFGGGIHVAIEAVVGHSEQVPTERVAALAVTIPIAISAAAFAGLMRITGSEAERRAAAVVTSFAALVVVFGLAAPVKVALIATAIAAVIGAIVQNQTVRRAVAVSSA